MNKKQKKSPKKSIEQIKKEILKNRELEKEIQEKIKEQAGKKQNQEFSDNFIQETPETEHRFIPFHTEKKKENPRPQSLEQIIPEIPGAPNFQEKEKKQENLIYNMPDYTSGGGYEMKKKDTWENKNMVVHQRNLKKEEFRISPLFEERGIELSRKPVTDWAINNDLENFEKKYVGTLEKRKEFKRNLPFDSEERNYEIR